MKIKLIFDKSGDDIDFTAVNQDVLEGYVNLLDNKKNNKFSAIGNIVYVNEIAKNLHVSIIESNKILKQLDLKEIKFFENIYDYFNQQTLNFLHEEWVLKQYEEIDIRKLATHSDNIIKQLGKQLLDLLPDENLINTLFPILQKINKVNLYDSININIHKLEDVFSECRFKTQNSIIERHNYDKNKILSNSKMHLRLSFQHTGRLLYNKFLRQDNELKFKDENNFDELVGYIDISFEKYQEIPFSKQYIDWCVKNKKLPLGQYLNFGYLPDLDKKLDDYRIILARNIMHNNFFKLELYKGN